MWFLAKFSVFGLVTYGIHAIQEKYKISEPVALSLYFSIVAVIFLL